MSTELEITLDGDSEAIKSHRLSIADLGKAMQKLLLATRSTASAILSNRSTEADSGRGGRIAEEAKRIDLELVTLKPGSTGVLFDVTMRPPTTTGRKSLPLPGIGVDLVPATAKRLIEEIADEAAGISRNPWIARYLQSVPSNISARYTARKDGAVIAETFVKELQPQPRIVNAPRIQVLVGHIAAVEVEPGNEAVWIKVASRRHRCEASTELRRKAYDMSGTNVRATVLLNPPQLVDGATNRPRLLRIDAVGAELGGTAEQRWEHMSTKWADTFAELAK